MASPDSPAGLWLRCRLTFNGHFFDFFGFLVDPFLSADFLCGAHQLLQLLDLLRRMERGGWRQ